MIAAVVWQNLTPMQADGLACVVCRINYLVEGRACQPVGRSHTGSQVFACAGECVQAAGDALTTWLCDDCTTPYSWRDKEALGTCRCGGELRPIGPDGFEVTR